MAQACSSMGPNGQCGNGVEFHTHGMDSSSSMYCSVVAFLTAEVAPPVDEVVAALDALGRPAPGRWRCGSEDRLGTVA